MFTDLDGYNSIWTAFSLIVLFGMIPVVLFILSKAASIANTKPQSGPVLEDPDEHQALSGKNAPRKPV